MGPILLVSSFGDLLEAAFDNMSLFPLKSWDAEDRVILSCVSRLFDLSLLALSNYPSQHRPWALVESGPGRKFSGPTTHFLKKKKLKYMMDIINIYLLYKLNGLC